MSSNPFETHGAVITGLADTFAAEVTDPYEDPFATDFSHTGRANGKTTAVMAAAVAAHNERPPAVAQAPTSRAAVIQAIAAHEAAAKALKEALTNEARQEYDENGTRVNWDLPGLGRFTASIEQEGIRVTDRAAWMRYAAMRWPTEIRMVPEWINPEVEKKLIGLFADLPAQLNPEDTADAEALAAILDARLRGQVMDDDGSILPGLEWSEGGTFRSGSLYLDSKVKRRVADMARRYAQGTGPLEIGA